MCEKFGKLQIKKYESHDDVALRMKCVELMAALKYTSDPVQIAYDAECLRNYVRFGQVYAPWWDKDARVAK